jgi:hypothetical protein
MLNLNEGNLLCICEVQKIIVHYINSLVSQFIFLVVKDKRIDRVRLKHARSSPSCGISTDVDYGVRYRKGTIPKGSTSFPKSHRNGYQQLTIWTHTIFYPIVPVFHIAY